MRTFARCIHVRMSVVYPFKISDVTMCLHTVQQQHKTMSSAHEYVYKLITSDGTVPIMK